MLSKILIGGMFFISGVAGLVFLLVDLKLLLMSYQVGVKKRRPLAGVIAGTLPFWLAPLFIGILMPFLQDIPPFKTNVLLVASALFVGGIAGYGLISSWPPANRKGFKSCFSCTAPLKEEETTCPQCHQLT